MPLRLEMELRNPLLSSYEGLKADFRLHNDDPVAHEIPSPYDRTSALTLEVYEAGGNLLRRMNGFSRQLMMNSTRVDPRPSLDTLAAGGAWEWSINFSRFHYTLPRGEFEVEAVYRYPEAGMWLRSERKKVLVESGAMTAMSTLSDNPVTEALSLVIEVQGEGGQDYYLRQHNLKRPLAAWYSERIISSNLAHEPFCAAANFFRTDTFDHSFHKWVVWQDGEQLFAQAFSWGQPVNSVRAASLPEQQRLLRHAFYTAGGELFVFFQSTEEAALVCYQFDETGLSEVFRHKTPQTNLAAALIIADERFIHLFIPRRGIVYERLSLRGASVERRELFRTRLPFCSAMYGSIDRGVKALFRDGTHGRIMQMVSFELDGDKAPLASTTEIVLRNRLHETGFDIDRKGRFHLLVSTRGRKLYYYTQERAPVLLARGEDLFFPRVVASAAGLYLGFHRKEFGYRFYQFSRSRHGHNIVNYDLQT